MHFDAIYDFKYIITLFLSHNVKIDIEDSEVNTPLWMADMNSNEVTESIKLLLEAGTDPRKPNKYGVIPEDLLEE